MTTVEKFQGTFDALHTRLLAIGAGNTIIQVLKLKGGEYIIMYN